MKRLFDMLLSGVGLLCLAPLLAAVAVAVRLDSPGPALFRQQRVGRGGKLFWIYKFRSMRIQQTEASPQVTASGDTRITRVGRRLRKAKIDELPQLWNVLKGDMSLVGPRPEVPQYVALYTPEQRRVLDLRPGITDPASLAFHDEEERLANAADPLQYYRDVLLPEKLRLAIDYANNANLWLDLRLLIGTVRRLVWSRLGPTRRTPNSTTDHPF